MSITTKVSRSIGYNIIGKAVTIITGFILLSFLMTRVSKDLYGISVIVLTLSGWLSAMDMGVGAAVMKYISEFSAKKDSKTIKKIINTSLTFYMAIGVFIGLIIFSISFFYEKIFKVAPEYIAEGRYLFIIAGVATCFLWSMIPFRQALMGLQRFDIVNKITILSNLGNLLIAYLVFRFTNNFPLYIAISQTFLVIMHFSYLFFLKHTLKDIKIKLFYFDKKTFYFIMKFSSYLFVGLICNILIFQTDNILAGIYVSTGIVTIYFAASRILDAIRMINGLFGAPFIAAFSELQGTRDYEKQKKGLIKVTKIETALMIPIVLITFIFASQIIQNWLGTDFLLAVPIMRILLVWWLFNGTLLIAQTVIVGKGQTQVFMWPNIINAVCNLVLSFILVQYFGIIGIALGTSIPMSITTIFLIRKILKRLEIPISEYLSKAIGLNVLFYAIIALLAGLAVKFITYSNIFMVVLIMALVYGVGCLIYYFIFLSFDDKQIVMKVLPIKRFISKIKKHDSI